MKIIGFRGMLAMQTLSKVNMYSKEVE